jgi:predicted ATPase/DNA-binding XRE family transcriptional regulator
MDGPATVGEWLRQRREALRLTRPELAQRASCSVPTLRKLEIDERRPSRELAESLAKALDLSPQDGLTFIRVARGELNLERLPALAPTAAQAGTTPPAAHELPIPLTPLIGREAELAALARLLADSTCRLLTIAGPGGIGKTRLAIQAARAHAAAQDAYFVALAPLSSPEFMAAAVADVLGFRFSGPADPATQLVRYLRDKSLLLVMDNFEHLLEGVELAAAILQRAPSVRLLVTSRERLSLHGEWVFELHGLPVPPAQAAIDPVEPPGETVASAVALFVHAARRTQADFEPRAEDWPIIARICRLTAGVPLAIELAASWVRVLSCAEIAAELERTLTSGANLDFLATSLRNVPGRHRSMRAVIDHSWKLLSSDEQRVLAELSVFRGGFTREAAAQVAGASLAQLLALVDKSLVQRAGTARYDLHDLVREYAAAKLAADSSQEAGACKRHSLFYLGWLERSEHQLKSQRQKAVVAELTGEMDNIRAAWAWAVANGQSNEVYTASPTLLYLFEVRNWFKEGQAAFARAAEALRARRGGPASDPNHPIVLHAMLAHWGYFQFRLGRCEDAYATLASSAAYLRNHSDSVATVYCLWYLGIDCWVLGRFSEAHESLHESLRLAQAQGLPWYAAWVSEFLGRLLLDRGEHDQAQRYLNEALATMRPFGDPSFTAHALSFLGHALRLLRRYREAESALRESLELARESDYRFAVGLALDGLGQVAYDEGRHSEAQVFLAESATIFRDMGDPDHHRLARVLNVHGLNALALGDRAGARHDFLAALKMAYEGGVLPPVLSALTGLAALDMGQDANQDALALVLFVHQHPASPHETKDRAARLRVELESRLPQAAIEAAQQCAPSMKLPEVVRQALADA